MREFAKQGGLVRGSRLRVFCRPAPDPLDPHPTSPPSRAISSSTWPAGTGQGGFAPTPSRPGSPWSPDLTPRMLATGKRELRCRGPAQTCCSCAADATSLPFPARRASTPRGEPVRRCTTSSSRLSRSPRWGRRCADPGGGWGSSRPRGRRSPDLAPEHDRPGAAARSVAHPARLARRGHRRPAWRTPVVDVVGPDRSRPAAGTDRALASRRHRPPAENRRDAISRRAPTPSWTAAPPTGRPCAPSASGTASLCQETQRWAIPRRPQSRGGVNESPAGA